MKNIFSYFFAAGLLALMLSGCASSPQSKFYRLSGGEGKTADSRDVSRQDSEVVSIGPLRIPDYLDRPQIVTRSGDNELRLAEFDRWAGSIENDILRTLVEDISAELPPDRFFVIRWTPLLESQLSSSYRVQMFVNRFECSSDNAVTLSAQWVITGKDNNLLLRKETVVVERVNGTGYGAIVNAMSRAIGRLSKEIADGIVKS